MQTFLSQIFYYISPLIVAIVSAIVQIALFKADKKERKRSESENKTILQAVQYGEELCESFDKLHELEDKYIAEIAELRKELSATTEKEFKTIAEKQIKIDARSEILSNIKILTPSKVSAYKQKFAELSQIIKK